MKPLYFVLGAVVTAVILIVFMFASMIKSLNEHIERLGTPPVSTPTVIETPLENQ